ncbi:MAG: cache domain-containing protein [Sulfurimonas sp.]|nr:cache domain-containing protein [Sulfurimonas sp.]
MIKEKTFLNIITYAPLFFIPIFVATIIIFSYQIYSKSFESSIKELEKNLLNFEKETTKNKVTNMSDLIVYKKSIIKDELTSRVQGRVNTAFKIAQNIYNEYKNTKTEQEIKDIIKTTLKAFLWNGGESFIWILDYNGVFNLAPEYMKHLEGSSVLDIKNISGKYVVKEEIAICKEKGEGFVQDTFSKPDKNDDKQYKQIAFVKAFGHYNWYFGSGEYIDTATKKTDKELFSMLEKVDNIGNNYTFVVNTKGDMLVNRYVPQFVGKNTNITDKLVKDTIETSINSLKDKENTAYIYDCYNKATDKIEKKYAYIQKIPNTDWIIGSGFYLSDIENSLMKQKVNKFVMYNLNFKYMFYMAILAILLALILSFFISQKIKKSFDIYKTRLCSKTDQLKELNHTLELKVTQRTNELEKIKNNFEKLATTDALTKIHNRYSLMNTISVEISRSHRYNTPLSIIMYDVDYFKKVNDTYGHDIGDSVLVLLSNLVKKNLRDMDIIGRYGGEEFLIILPNTILDDAQIFAERLRKEVEEASFKTVNALTVSIGVAELQPNENEDKLFKRVDELLYMSKKNGRNRISF